MSEDPPAAPLLQAMGLSRHFEVASGSFGRATVKAVDGVDLAVMPGECFGLVGESGSGKSTLARLLLRLIPATAGRLVFDGIDFTQADARGLRELRRCLQIVFQNPHSALNGRHTVFDAIAEPLRLQQRQRGTALARSVHALMDQVSLPQSFAWRYPHELSGGQKQRVCIARALAPHPRLVVLDEPTSALDVSVQAQILSLLQELQRERKLTYLFISHNLAVVRHLCHRVAVLYLGKVVEQGDTARIFGQPQHPYTQALLAAAPRLQGGVPPALLIGEVPSASAMPPGCRFHPRCPEVQVAACRTELPLLRAVAAGQHCACHLRAPGLVSDRDVLSTA